MRESKASKIKFWVVAGAALVLGAVGVTALVPVTQNFAHAQSDSLTAAGRTANGGEAEADYQLATWLNRSNTSAYFGLAQTQIAAGQPDLAVDTLMHAGRGSAVVALRVRTLIELGRSTDAATSAQALTDPGSSQANLQLAGLAYALTSQPAGIAALTPRLTSPEAAESVSRAGSGKLPLAAELYATGLLNSSSAILAAQPVSFERNLLLARINYDRHTAGNLSQATRLLETAVTLSPTNLEARQLLAKVYADQGKPAAASQQTALADQIITGRP